jgi:hypothetical protein
MVIGLKELIEISVRKCPDFYIFMVSLPITYHYLYIDSQIDLLIISFFRKLGKIVTQDLYIR